MCDPIATTRLAEYLMDRKLRIEQYCCGKMSVYTMRYAIEKGAEIVCAFGRSSNIGKDVGEIAGIGKTGVLVQDSKDAAAIMKETQPDDCIIRALGVRRIVKVNQRGEAKYQ